MGFDFDHEQRRRLGYQLIDGINDYYASLSNLSVQRPLAERTSRDLSDALPEQAGDPAAILRETMDDLVTHGFHGPSANYFGLMNPTPTYMAVLSEAMVAALNPPPNVTGWNAFVGSSPTTTSLQNSSPIAIGDTWTLSAAVQTGACASQGQQPTWFLVDQRVIERG